jgi:hypothetical protein
MSYPTTHVELTTLDLLNLKNLVRYRITRLQQDKHDHPDLAHVFEEQIQVHEQTFARLDRAHIDMYPARAA